MAEKKNPFLARINKIAGAITDREKNIHDFVIRTGSPSVDFVYANKWGLPRGAGEIRFGFPKGGKSLLAFANTGQVHADYPNGHVFKFDTEYRDHGQLSPEKAKQWGIDLDRYHCIQTNTPEGVFDVIEQEIAAMCEDGLDVPLIIIDSINGIMGRRMQNADSIGKMQIGDAALTLQEGFKRILRVQRKYNIAIVGTAQVRAEMDQNEIRRGHLVKMASSFGVQHWAEYFMFVERLKTVAGRKDMLGNEFINKAMTDIAGNEDATAHRIRVTMRDNSYGPAGRQGILTFDYQKGLVLQHHELFELAAKRKVIETNGSWYSFGNLRWQKNGFLEALTKDPDLFAAIRKGLMESENNKIDAIGIDAGADEDAVTPGD